MKRGAVVLILGAVLAAAGLLGATFQALYADPHSWSIPSSAPWLVLAGIGAAVVAAGVVLLGRGVAHERSTPHTFLTGPEEQKVLEAIRTFEKRTSGELRLHLSSAGGEVMEAAKAAFNELGLTATRERNGVLFFVEVGRHRFAVLGDQGIDQKVPPGFWDQVVERVRARFAEGKFGDGLVEGMQMAGEALATYFPARGDDKNELPDEISRK
jgi:uncharacterized membrane protein